MKSGDALKEFHGFLQARGMGAAKLSVDEGIDAMIDFYRSARADDCLLDHDGDMLLFQWGSHDWGKGPHFELDITRQFIRDDGEDEDIWQLSLTFVFPPTAMASGNHWCLTPDDLDAFAKFVVAHPAFAASLNATPLRVELDFERAG